MKIYIDSECKCHVNDDGTMTAVEDDFFDGKCPSFIEGHRLKPDGVTWVREDGTAFSGGKMITPWVDSRILEAYQRQYEAMEAELATAYQEGVNSV